MTIRCKAAVLRQSGAPRPFVDSKPLSIEEVDLLPPGPNEVVIKIAGAGLCHSAILCQPDHDRGAFELPH